MLPLTDPSLPCVFMRAGICCDPIDRLTPEFPFSSSLKKSPHPHVYSQQRKRWICPENMPPATLTPRGLGNIHTGEHYWLQVLYYVPSHSFLLLGESDLTHMQKIKQVLANWIQMGNFWVIQTVSSEATGLFCPLTKAKHKEYTCVCICEPYLQDMIKSRSTCITNSTFPCLHLQIVLETYA